MPLFFFFAGAFFAVTVGDAFFFGFSSSLLLSPSLPKSCYHHRCSTPSSLVPSSLVPSSLLPLVTPSSLPSPPGCCCRRCYCYHDRCSTSSSSSLARRLLLLLLCLLLLAVDVVVTIAITVVAGLLPLRRQPL